MTAYIKENKINVILLSLYLSFVFFSQVIVAKVIGIKLVLIYIVLLVLSFVLSSFLMWLVSAIKINIKSNEGKKRLKIFIIDFLILFMVHFVINYFKVSIANKELFESDMRWAIMQAADNSYYEFSSPIFILLFAKIPLLITQNQYFVIVFYMIIRSLIISLVISGICDNLFINIILLIYYTCMPLSIHSELCLMKDTPCGLFTMLSIYLIYKSIYKTDKKSHLIYDILIAITLILVYYMRPNAILYSIPMCVALFIVFIKNIKRSIRIVVVFIVGVLLVNMMMFNVLKTTRTSSEKSLYEIMSIPITAVLAVAKEKPEALNEEEKTFVKNISGGNEHFIDEFDEKRGYESVKFNGNIEEAIKGMTYMDIMEYAIDLLKKEPYIVCRQWILSTCGLYSYRYLMIKNINAWYASIYYFLQNIEMPILLFLLLLVVLARNKIGIGCDMNNIFLVIPILLFAGGTMMAITSPAIFRYYLPLQMSVPVYILNNMKKEHL